MKILLEAKADLAAKHTKCKSGDLKIKLGDLGEKRRDLSKVQQDMHKEVFGRGKPLCSLSENNKKKILKSKSGSIKEGENSRFFFSKPNVCMCE